MADAPTTYSTTQFSVRWAVAKQVAGPALVFIFVWILYLVRLIWGTDLLHLRDKKEAVDAATMFYIALFFSMICIGYALFGVRRALGVVRYGVEVAGRVASFSALKKYGSCPIRYEYEFEGRTYQGAIEVSEDEAATYRKNPAIAIVVNSRNPQQSLPKSKLRL